MIQRHLEGIPDWRIRCREAGSAEETRRTLSREDPSLIILDYKLPKESGISVLSSLRGNYTKPMLPVIMTSGQGNENLAGRSIREGAMDYVPKDELSSRTLRKSIERVLERYGHLRAGRNRERLVEPHTLKDELTGLLNWRYFLHRLDEELSRLDRYDSFFSLVALRLDNYDELVDLHGQTLAKKFLERIGHLLRVDLRTSDIIGRHNRDSFWIISPGTPVDEARLLARRLSRKLLEGLRIPGESERLSSTLHGGIISVNSREQKVKNLMNAHLLVRKVRTVLSKAHQPEMMDILSYESFQDPDTAS
jgi:diguanylate cyclase (GGDEF)-like protein